MKAYYRITLIDSKSKNTIYELRVEYQSYLIAIFFIGTHYPSKRLGRIKPSRYFEKIKDKDLHICLSSLKDMTIVADYTPTTSVVGILGQVEDRFTLGPQRDSPSLKIF